MERSIQTASCSIHCHESALELKPFAACAGFVSKMLRVSQTPTVGLHLRRFGSVVALMALLATAIPAWSDSAPPTADEAALLPAAERGNDEVIRRLIAKGIRVSELDDATAALNSAIEKQHVSTVKLLLEAGVDPNRTDFHYTPLSVAALDGSPEIVTLLLRHGADPNLAYEGQTALCSVTVDANNSEAVHVTVATRLMAAGASASVDEPCESLEGGTPLRGAIKNNKVALARVFLKAGANPNKIMDPTTGEYVNGEVPLQAAIVWASYFHDTAMTKLLLDFGANPNYRNDRMFVEFKYLADHWSGISPLVLAVKQTNWAVVKLLLDRGADPCLPRTDGKTPYEIALDANDQESAKLIIGKTKQHACAAASHIPNHSTQ